MTYCEKRFAFGSETFNEPSRFLLDLPPGAVEESKQDSFVQGGSLRSGKQVYAFGKPGAAGRPGKPGKAGLTLYKVGDRVTHRAFGEGDVMSVDGSMVEVVFDSVGRKTLESTVAPMSVKGP